MFHRILPEMPLCRMTIRQIQQPRPRASNSPTTEACPRATDSPMIHVRPQTSNSSMSWAHPQAPGRIISGMSQPTHAHQWEINSLTNLACPRMSNNSIMTQARLQASNNPTTKSCPRESNSPMIHANPQAADRVVSGVSQPMQMDVVSSESLLFVKISICSMQKETTMAI